MSIHAELSPEALARLAAQRRNSTISSIVIALLATALLLLILGIVALKAMVRESPTIVTYQSDIVEEEEVTEKKVSTSQERKPSAPSSSMAKVIATSAVSNVAVPVPDVDIVTPSMEFGDGNGFGSGWGDGSGDGGGASFFNQNVKARRIVYVIDYSMSMKGERDKLMRRELTKSVEGLSGGTKFQMIYFSGPAWVAGSEMPGYNYNTGKATVRGKGGYKYDWTGKGLHDWTPKGKRQPVEWMDATPKQLEDSLKVIKESPLSGGTDWENPLLMAFDMEPPPQVVFFMTDGAVGGRDMMALVKDLASEAGKKKIVVNTIALMEPKAEAPMADLAKRTGGQFTIVGSDSKVRPGGKGKKRKK